ncbi:MAG: hypothetical protein H6502_04095 [Candidatus Woesearchaeota archaeon]|nr:MAG: hypothetical protein H6502_04095 [Candidatus Woesearchaeota archaeon]
MTEKSSQLEQLEAALKPLSELATVVVDASQFHGTITLGGSADGAVALLLPFVNRILDNVYGGMDLVSTYGVRDGCLQIEYVAGDISRFI